MHDLRCTHACTHGYNFILRTCYAHNNYSFCDSCRKHATSLYKAGEIIIKYEGDADFNSAWEKLKISFKVANRETTERMMMTYFFLY